MLTPLLSVRVLSQGSSGHFTTFPLKTFSLHFILNKSMFRHCFKPSTMLKRNLLVLSLS